MAAKEQEEAQQLSAFLPEELSDDALNDIIESVRAEHPDVQGMALMKFVIPVVDGRADSSKIRDILQNS